MSKYLDGSGLEYLWSKIKATFFLKTDAITPTTVSIDSTPTANSTNLVTSGGVKTALDAKLDTITFNTTYNASSNKAATMSDIPSVPTKVSDLTNDSGFTSNAGTVTGIKMNNGSAISPVSGVVDLGTVITSHQDISNYVLKSSTSGLIKNDGTVDTSTYLTSAPVTSVNGYTGAVTLTIPTVPSNLVTGSSLSYTIWVGTESAYNLLTKDANTLYFILEATS